MIQIPFDYSAANIVVGLRYRFMSVSFDRYKGVISRTESKFRYHKILILQNVLNLS